MTDLLRTVRALALCALLPCTAAASPAASPYLEAARGVAAWLTDATQEGQRWPVEVDNDGSTLRFGTVLGLDQGAAGIGLFFIKLHSLTDDEQHLAMATAAAQSERSYHLQGLFNGPDYLAGAAGSGLFFLAMHEHTGDARYVDWARDVAAWLEDTALRPVPDQAWWWHYENHPNHYVGVPHGAAGVALFQLALYERTGDAAYLADAEDAYRWVRTHALEVGTGGALGFKRKASDSDIYNWWSGGSAGILLLQGSLYGVTGNVAYLDDLRRTADGLVALADEGSPAGVNWTTGSDESAYRPIVFSHGNGSIAPALLIALGYTGDTRYLATAEASIAWLVAMARDGATVGAEGLFWEHSQGSSFPGLRPSGAFVGTGSVGWVMARMFPLTTDAAHRALALASADYLLATAEAPVAGQLRWLNYPGPENTNWDAQAYSLGWYDGNAGIGLFLLAAHELLIGLRPALDVHAP